jgi:hypothetical protein
MARGLQGTGQKGDDMDNIYKLPDGSAFACLTLPLPEAHWIYQKDKEGFSPPPPMPLRMAIGPERDAFAEQVRGAAKWAIQGATMQGAEMDFDPDAMVQNFIVGLLGYWSKDGLSGETWGDPDPVPPLFTP